MTRKKTEQKAAPLTPAERQRAKRIRDRDRVWGDTEDLESLSDSGLLQQLAEAFRKDRAAIRAGKRGPAHGLFAKGLIKEVQKRIK